MFKEIRVHANFNERTGYGIHSSRFFPKLDALKPEGGEGVVHISLLDTVTASQATTFPPKPSILYNVWESDLQPEEFISKLKNYTQLWVPSEWQRACSIAQGVPEEFVKVVPEGVDPDIYHPVAIIDPPCPATFDFLICGQWQRRKSTLEMVQAFLKAFPDNPNVRLYLSTDTLFPSDPWKSTEERLEKNGIFDDRIIPVHFEERPDYIRRLQNAHIFLSCSRAEGWNLPLCEAMAVGTPAIAADHSGSTEYAGDALLVRVPKLEKPEGIYGNWQVPGFWGSPDYDHLTELMRDAYENYSSHKEKALKTSEMIRTKFSWEAAAKKAYAILEELWQKEHSIPVTQVVDHVSDIRSFARSRGYDIKSMEKIKALFTVDCWPDSGEKMNTLVETIKQIHDAGYECLVCSHYPLPAPVIELADHYVYEKRDILSGADKPVYRRTRSDGTVEQTVSRKEYHGVAALNNIRNAINFCKGKYDWMYQMNSDVEVDLQDWIQKVLASDKDMVCVRWDNNPRTIGGQVWDGKVELFDKLVPYLNSWEEYAKRFPEFRFLTERWLYEHVSQIYDVNKIDFIEMELSNRFDQTDRELWPDDDFQCHFVEGPYLNIVGLSRREYDVTYGNPIDGPVFYHLRQKPGMWSRPSPKFYRDWTVKASLGGVLKFNHKMDLKGKRVLISMGSKALGDTIAWMPYIDEFRKKNECHVICSGWWQDIFDYPELELVAPGSEVQNIYASYAVGCFDDQPDMNPKNWRLTPLQKVASDILGLEYEPIRATLKFKKGNGAPPYICFSEFSTMQNKFWNREGGWQEVMDYLVSLGYECVSVSAEQTQLKNVTSHNGQTIQDTIADIAGAEFYIGLNHGPAWLAYSLDKPCVMLTGVSEEWNDFPNPYRIAVNNEVCGTGCFNDTSIPIDRSWAWCPREKNYICTRSITPAMVIEQIDRIRGDKKCP